MVAVRVVEVIANQVIHVIPVRYGLVAAVGTVDVLVVVLDGVIRGALRRVPPVHRKRVLFYGAVLTLVVQVAVVRIVHVPVVAEALVLAAGAVLVVVSGVYDLRHVLSLGSLANLFLSMRQNAPQQVFHVPVRERVVVTDSPIQVPAARQAAENLDVPLFAGPETHVVAETKRPFQRTRTPKPGACVAGLGGKAWLLMVSSVLHIEKVFNPS